MRRTLRRPIRGRPQATASLSLFPFLAVLICTMGALILLLVVIARQARLQAAQAAAEKAGRRRRELLEELEIEREGVQWRIEQLRIARQKTRSQMAEARMALGHVEDHSRRLEDQLARLKVAWEDLDRLDREGARRGDELEAELPRVRARVAEAQQRLDHAHRAAAERRRSYAVVPYRGPHQTRRLPLYIECRADSVVVQPEGIVLTEEDFDGPLGPGNPLAAALRAAREYLLVHRDFDLQDSGEPYPLLLVRPDGIAAYYAARAAMPTWDSEFGYELIGRDWELQFPAPDPRLAEVVQRAVDAARARQRMLASAAPSHYAKPQGRPWYRASPGRGGAVRDRGSSSARVPSRESWEGSSGGTTSGGERGSRPGASVDGSSRDGSSPQGSSPRGTGAFGPAAQGLPCRSGAGPPALRPGEWHPRQTSSDARPDEQAASQQPECLAKVRGRNWGLPDAAAGSIPITRPIRLQCEADRLVLLPETGGSAGKSIPLASRTADSVDALISAIWEQMQSWGIAGHGMYWRPTLQVLVAPGAEQRYRDLQALLEGSGLTVESK